MRLGILKSFKAIEFLVKEYALACEYLGVDYTYIDIINDNWIDNIKKANIDGVLVRIKGNIQEQKAFFDEVVYIISDVLKIPVYPSKNELFLYENKRLYYYFLKSKKLPHVPTYVVYDKKRSLDIIEKMNYPIVLKMNSGSSASGVFIIKSKIRAKIIVHKIFGILDERLSFGNTPYSRKYLIPIPKFGLAQKHYIIIQPFIKIKWEWRIIKIGNSYFGYKRLLEGNFTNNPNNVEYAKPPIELLNMTKKICDEENFDSMSIDIFEDYNEKYYINEMQSLFGSFTEYQMKIENVPGRYVYNNNSYLFEEGIFNKYGSNILRVEHFVEKLKNK